VNIDHLLNTSFTHKRITRTTDGQGGWTEGESTQGTVKGRYHEPNARDLEQAPQGRADVNVVAYVGASESIERKDLLYDGTSKIEVVSITVPSKPVYQKIYGVLVQEGN